jgi:hypothetical protein
MARPSATALLLILAVVASGPALAAQPKPLPLNARLIAHGEFAGFGPFGPAHVTTFRNARAWVAGNTQLTPTQVSNAVAALHREGFVAAATEQLGSLKPYRGGLSWVTELGSTAKARAEVARTIAITRAAGYPFAPFKVIGIPGAVAYRAGTSSQGGDNILFADGRFAYLVGDGWGPGGKPARPALIAAAQNLYKRVHGHPAA